MWCDKKQTIKVNKSLKFKIILPFRQGKFSSVCKMSRGATQYLYIISIFIVKYRKISFYILLDGCTTLHFLRNENEQYTPENNY